MLQEEGRENESTPANKQAEQTSRDDIDLALASQLASEHSDVQPITGR